MLRRREPPQLLLKGLRRLLLFPPCWGMLPVEPVLDELLDLPSGNIELTGNRRPDHWDMAILPGGGELHGAGLVSRRRGARTYAITAATVGIVAMPRGL